MYKHKKGRFSKECRQCSKKFVPATRQSHLCDSCVRNNFIKSMFKRNNKFKDCSTLKTALSKYGK